MYPRHPASYLLSELKVNQHVKCFREVMDSGFDKGRRAEGEVHVGKLQQQQAIFRLLSPLQDFEESPGTSLLSSVASSSLLYWGLFLCFVCFALVLHSAGKYQISNAFFLINILQDLFGNSNL